MNVTTITMTKADAKKAFQDYQAAVRADRADVRKVWKQEDIGLMQAYKQLAKGHAVLDLPAAMKAAGVKPFENASVPLPVLAVAPADALCCSVLLQEDGGAVFVDAADGWKWTPRPRKPRRATILAADTYPRRTWNEIVKDRHRSTLVPIIPPHLRPKFTLANYWTLWEVENWRPEPPKDPMLLKKLGGGLYAVLATWDLTPVEQAILKGRVPRS